MSGQIERYEPASMGVLALSDSQWDRFKTAIALLAAGGSEFMPDGLKSVQQAQAAALVCLGLGVDPLTAIGGKKVFVVKGRVAFHYQLVLGMCVKHLPEFRYEILEHTDEVCSARFRRSEAHPWHAVSFTFAQAQQMGVVKPESNWMKARRDMLWSKVVHRGCNLAAPDVLAGLPPEPEEFEVVDESVAEGDGESSAAVIADEIGGEMLANDEPAAPEARSDADSAKRAFWSSAAKAGWSTAGKTIGALLKELLTVEGVVPSLKSSAELAAQDWRNATARLAERYPNGKPDTWPRVKAGGPQPEGVVEVSVADGPPPAIEDEQPSASDEMAGDGAAILRAQMSTPDFLRDLCADVLRVTKVRMVSDDGAWFVYGPVLKGCGMVDESGAAQPRSLVPHPKFAASPGEVLSLSTAVKSVLDTFNNRGKQVVPRSSGY